MLAIFGNLSTGELMLALVIAVLVFGRRLPQVAAQGAHHLGKLRRSLFTMWRDTGLSEEWRTLQRDVHESQRFDPARAAREMSRDAAGRPRSMPLAPPAGVADPGLRAAPEVAPAEPSSPPAAGLAPPDTQAHGSLLHAPAPGSAPAEQDRRERVPDAQQPLPPAAPSGDDSSAAPGARSRAEDEAD